jgi:peptidoglycan/LPS O-acetylase OafA/YrhL
MSQIEPQLSHPKYRPDIDGLRAVAVVSVVAFHAFPTWVEGGFVGVDIFFVISGFLISTIIFENLERGTFTFAEFYARRIKRIFPALLVVLIACYALGWFVLLADEYKQLGKHIAGGAGFVANYVLWSESGYFDNSADTKPLLHLWSLGIEEQFYILWPLLLWLAWKRKFKLTVAIALVAGASLFLHLRGINGDAVAAFYSPQTRFWELLCGSLLALVLLHPNGAYDAPGSRLAAWAAKTLRREPLENGGRTLANVLSVVGCVLLVYGLWHENRDSIRWTVVPVLGAALMIWAGAHAWINRTVLSNRVLVWFGLISFPLYLWHWPLLSFARIAEGDVPSKTIRWTCILLSVVLAWLTYELVERRARVDRHGVAKVAVLAVLMALVGYVGYDTYSREGLPFRMPQLEANISQLSAGFPATDSCKANHPFVFLSCYESERKYGESLYLIGDSHMLSLSNGFKKIFDDGILKYNATAIGNAGCNPFMNVESMFKGVSLKCAGVITGAITEAARREDVKWIVLVGRHAARYDGTLFGEPENGEPPMSYRYASGSVVSTSPSGSFELGLRETIDALVKSHKKVVFVHQLPELGFDPRRCVVFRHISSKNYKCSISREEAELRLSPYKSAVRRIIGGQPDFIEYDPIQLVCEDAICGPFNAAGNLMYYDEDHMSKIGAEFMAKAIAELIAREGAEAQDYPKSSPGVRRSAGMKVPDAYRPPTRGAFSP